MSAEPGRVLNGRYRLIRTVGIGSQASVWVAEHLALSTQVAVKLIDPDLAKRPDARERFKREATAAAQLRSPHVVQILDHGIEQAPEGDQPFIVMELLEGEDLFQRLEKRHHLSVKDTAKIMTQIARALTRAHAAGIVHRDLKPENIFLTHNDDDEIVKVLDFGVAKVRDAAKVTMQKTGVGTLIGTPHYMSPEQVKGIGEVDYRTDIWAFGVLAYQCVTGELPFDSEGVGDLLIKITIGEMPVPSKVLEGVPPAFDGWFARACDRDPARRFASARAAAEALARIAGFGVGAGPTAVPRPSASIPPPADPTKRPSELPPPPATKSAKPPPPPAPSKPESKAEELDDDDWEEAEPVAGGRIGVVTEELPAAQAPRPPKAPASPPPSAPSRPGAPPPAAIAPAPPSRPSRAGAPPSAPSSDGPVNPFLVNDFIAPPVSAPQPPAPHPQAPHPQAPAPAPVIAAAPEPRPIQQAPSSLPGSSVSGVETVDFDEDAFGSKDRRKKLVRWFTIGLVLLVVGVTWAVVSSQLRARDPEPAPATSPEPTAPPPVPPAFDPEPATTPSDTGSATTSAPTTKPTSKPRPGPAPGPGTGRPVPTKKPSDGSVELPTPGDDPGLPPPAP
ncbi:MAG: serine/threonine protein kinase [Polyangiaceae bacterium]|nr:serine/threonine protein kinase [Polyangiaceae bacterium]